MITLNHVNLVAYRFSGSQNVEISVNGVLDCEILYHRSVTKSINCVQVHHSRLLSVVAG